jgi:hypothetical protein
MSQARRELEDKVTRLVLERSFFRWESATVIALTLLLSFFGPQVDAISFVRSWMWLLGGLLAEAALIYAGYSDPNLARTVVEELFQKRFQPKRINHKEYQDKLNRALDYRSRIEAAIQTQPEGILKNNLTETAEQIDDWLENIYSLAERLDRHAYEKTYLHRDRSAAIARTQELRQQLETETNPAVREQIDITRGTLDHQVETINALEATMERAALQLEHSLSALGTIYSQAMLVDAKDIDRGRAKRLQQEIAEEVTGLSDVLAAMDEVYAEGAKETN